MMILKETLGTILINVFSTILTTSPNEIYLDLPAFFVLCAANKITSKIPIVTYLPSCPKLITTHKICSEFCGKI